METELLFEQAKNDLDDAKEKLDAGEIDLSLCMLASSYSHVRALMSIVFVRKVSPIFKYTQPGENDK